jgi:hypothetical protein
MSTNTFETCESTNVFDELVCDSDLKKMSKNFREFSKKFHPDSSYVKNLPVDEKRELGNIFADVTGCFQKAREGDIVCKKDVSQTSIDRNRCDANIDKQKPTLEEILMKNIKSQHPDKWERDRIIESIPRQNRKVVSEKYELKCPDGCPEIPRRFDVYNKNGELRVKPICRIRSEVIPSKEAQQAECGRAIRNLDAPLGETLMKQIEAKATDDTDKRRRIQEVTKMTGEEIAEEYGFRCPAPCQPFPSGVRWQGGEVRPICNPIHSTALIVSEKSDVDMEKDFETELKGIVPKEMLKKDGCVQINVNKTEPRSEEIKELHQWLDQNQKYRNEFSKRFEEKFKKMEDAYKKELLSRAERVKMPIDDEEKNKFLAEQEKKLDALQKKLRNLRPLIREFERDSSIAEEIADNISAVDGPLTEFDIQEIDDYVSRLTEDRKIKAPSFAKGMIDLENIDHLVKVVVQAPSAPQVAPQPQFITVPDQSANYRTLIDTFVSAVKGLKETLQRPEKVADEIVKSFKSIEDDRLKSSKNVDDKKDEPCLNVQVNPTISPTFGHAFTPNVSSGFVPTSLGDRGERGERGERGDPGDRGDRGQPNLPIPPEEFKNNFPQIPFDEWYGTGRIGMNGGSDKLKSRDWNSMLRQFMIQKGGSKRLSNSQLQENFKSFTQYFHPMQPFKGCIMWNFEEGGENDIESLKNNFTNIFKYTIIENTTDFNKLGNDTLLILRDEEIDELMELDNYQFIVETKKLNDKFADQILEQNFTLKVLVVVKDLFKWGITGLFKMCTLVVHLGVRPLEIYSKFFERDNIDYAFYPGTIDKVESWKDVITELFRGVLIGTPFLENENVMEFPPNGSFSREYIGTKFTKFPETAKELRDNYVFNTFPAKDAFQYPYLTKLYILLLDAQNSDEKYSLDEPLKSLIIYPENQRKNIESAIKEINKSNDLETEIIYDEISQPISSGKGRINFISLENIKKDRQDYENLLKETDDIHILPYIPMKDLLYYYLYIRGSPTGNSREGEVRGKLFSYFPIFGENYFDPLKRSRKEIKNEEEYTSPEHYIWDKDLDKSPFSYMERVSWNSFISFMMLIHDTFVDKNIDEDSVINFKEIKLDENEKKIEIQTQFPHSKALYEQSKKSNITNEALEDVVRNVSQSGGSKSGRKSKTIKYNKLRLH